MVEADVLPSFSSLNIFDNPDGWGPHTLPDQYKDMPYQPFSKDTRIGKVADWTGNIYQDRRYQNRYMSHLPSAVGGNQYTYFHEEDESSFVLVDTQKNPTRLTQRQRYQRFTNAQRLRREKQKFAQAAAGPQMSKMQMRSRQQHMRRWNKQMNQRQNQDFRRGGQRITHHRESSVVVQESWVVMDELDFLRLAKLSVPQSGISEPTDLYLAGEMELYDKLYDRISTKSERKLQRVNRAIHTVTTSQDPIIRALAKEGKGKLFITDSILSSLMCCTRSNYSWDVVVQKVGDKLFFDKRDDSDFDLLTVFETAAEPPTDENGSLNSPKSLALEATFINHNFSQQVFKPNEEKHKFKHKNPFVEEDEESEVASVGYRYRKFNIGENLDLIVRCEHDGFTHGPNGEIQYMSIKALNEFNPHATGAVNWRTKMDSQRGAVLAAELKNNAFKLAKWTVCSLLAGSDQLKLGYVSRVNPNDSSKHVILGTQQFKPLEFASQINLAMENCWGIFKCLVTMLLDKDNGKYLILKDPNKSLLRLYDIPNNAFDSDEGESSDNEGQDEDDDDDDK